MAELVGFSGDRALAFALLHEAKDTGTYWSPCAAALLLYYDVLIAPNLGLGWDAALLADADAILQAPALAVCACVHAWMRASVAGWDFCAGGGTG